MFFRFHSRQLSLIAFSNSFCNQCVRSVHKSSNLIAFRLGYKPSRFLPSKRNFHVTVKWSSSSKQYSSGKALQTNIKKSEIKRLILLTKPEKWKLTGAIGLLLVSSAVTMAVPFALGHVIDIIYTTDSSKMKDNLNKLCIVLVAVFLTGAICNFGRVYLMNVSGQRITKTLTERVFKAVVSQETAFFDKHRTGELINRLSADTSLVSQSVTMNISDGLRSGIMVIAGISMMFYMSVKLAIVSLTIVPPVAAISIMYGRFVKKITKDVQDTLADANNVAEERIANIRTVKSFSKEGSEIKRYCLKMNDVFILAKRESFGRGVFYAVTGFSGNAIVLSVLYYGGIMVADSSITVGNLSAFLLYAAYIGVSIGGLSSFYSEMNRGIGASTRLWELIDRQPSIPVTGGRVIKSISGEVTFKDVCFSYPSRQQHLILNRLSLKLLSNSCTAIVGASGSGKSTIASLLLRLYDPQSGAILFDDIPINECDPFWLRKQIGTVSQEPVLFSGTIRENILYGVADDETISDSQIVEAAKESNSLPFIDAFPEKFETKVGEKGVMLSGGQKQRIAIARALIKNPKILLLDEATSALDAESEYLVQEALQRILKGRTVLTIAHRLSTIKSADNIAVLEAGKIVEMGSYDSLISNDGPFKNLIKHQAIFSS